MRKIELEIPNEVFGDFAETLSATRFNNRVLGRNTSNEIKIEVFYNKRDAAAIDELEEYVQELKENRQNNGK